MPKARKEQISLNDTPYYHCISRCVRRAFLCGSDPLSGKDYQHRKQWMIERLTHLAQIFAIEIYAYSLMDNHSHLVLKVNTQLSSTWQDDEIIRRWQRLFSLPVLIERYQSGLCDTPAQKDKARETIELWRQRLMDISWFMRCLNEHIARKANAEDQCTGRFWDWFLRPAKPAYITSL